MRIRGDVCRRKSVEINHNQAMQCVRLLEALRPNAKAQYALLFKGIVRVDLCDSLVIGIDMEPLSSVGHVCPGGYEPNFIRAVFQNQLEWTCTRLPDLDILCKLLHAFDPATEWDYITSGDGKIGSFFLQISIDGRQTSTSLLSVINRQLIWSQQLEADSRSWRTVGTGPMKMLFADIIDRLNRSLPHLIRLAGGKVKFL